MNSLQRLLRVCERTVADKVLSDPGAITIEAVKPILNELHQVDRSDLKLNVPWHWSLSLEGDAAGGSHVTETESILDGKPPQLYYYHVEETELFSIGVFILPPGSSIPMHDHPHMCVLSKVLYGSLNVWSYDWADYSKLEENRSFGGAARIVDNGTMYVEGSTKILFPSSGGNMHEFYSPTEADSVLTGPAVGCAILDVIIPPYDEGNGRACTYFSKQMEKGSNTYVHLTPTTPAGFSVVNLN